MKVAALFSGGKDSTFSVFNVIQNGHKVECLVTIHPRVDDSMLFHYPNNKIARSVAEAMEIPFIGITVEAGSSKEAEYKALEEAIIQVKSTYNIQGIVNGAISSNFQNGIFREVCFKHNLIMLTPLWHIQPYEYLHTLVNNHFHIKIVAVSAMGLDNTWLGKDLDRESIIKLKSLSKMYGINITFEGGEAETLTLDCPIFKKRLLVKKSNIQWDGQRGIFEILELALISKEELDAG
jgi:ABC transporter with metal-binding/Fe-S-binding domain ATP-binding protein